MNRIVFSVVVLAAVWAYAEENDPGSRVYEDILFSTEAPELKMTLILPEKTAKPSPCVMVIQGGGFKAQDGKRFTRFAHQLAENGFAAAMIAYRGRPDHKYMDTISDIKAAVRYVRKVSGKYNIDPDRIGAMGRSAGGTLVGLLAVTGGMKEFEGNGGNAEFSSSIQAGVSYSGVFDFVERFMAESGADKLARRERTRSNNAEWLGSDYSSTNRDWINASAVTHVDKDDAPMLLIACKDDRQVFWRQSQSMYNKMLDAGIAAESQFYETGGHGARLNTDEGFGAMVDFFKKHL